MMLSQCFLVLFWLFSHVETVTVSTDQHTGAEIGKHVILKCTFDQIDNNPTVMWEKVGVKQTVHQYKGNVDDFSEQHGNYTKRTEIDGSTIKKGDASLTLKNVNIWDEGIYKCSVSNDHGFGEAFMNLSVWAKSTVGIRILWKSNGSDVLSCQSSGWYPAPDVTWSDTFGNNLYKDCETKMIRDSSGLFHVSHDLKQMHNSQSQYVCSIQHEWMAEPERTRVAFTDGATMIRMDDGKGSPDL
ncbi:V-set domain-containing T-cell activation inhibitor 1 [Heterodontus francisci]|uniref:V-set domain-containing T-cell activation inhibitor 1 n=1 Tax=Heterodontus francisci TaxID=7792 RepID=UPI00355B66C0